jgi:hypothetical protein
MYVSPSNRVSQKKDVLAARSRALKDINGEISAIETRISMTQIGISKNEQDIARGQAKLAPYCPDGQRFPDVLKEGEDELVNKREIQVAQESGNTFFGNIIKAFEKKNCCSTCKRGFASDEEANAFLLSVRLLD